MRDWAQPASTPRRRQRRARRDGCTAPQARLPGSAGHGRVRPLGARTPARALGQRTQWSW